MSQPSLQVELLRHFKWRWTTPRGAMDDGEILKTILDDKAFCEIRFKRVVMLDRGLTSDPNNQIALLIWEYCGHNSQQLCNMWQWAEHLELFKRDASQDVEYIRELWVMARRAETMDKDIGTGLEIFEHKLTNQATNPSLVSFSRELYRAYIALATVNDPGSGRELLHFPLEYPFRPGVSVDVGLFEAGLDFFLIKRYWEEITNLIEIWWEALKLDCDVDLSFLSSAPENHIQDGSPRMLLKHYIRDKEQIPRLRDNSLVFDVAGSGKTQKIFDCSFRRPYKKSKSESSKRDQDILTLRRGGASRDMELLYKYGIPTHFYENLGLENGLLASSARLKFNRDVMLMLFETKVQNPYNRRVLKGPQKWLLFQTICGCGGNDFDPFYSTLRILMLVVNFIDVLKLNASGSFSPVIASIVCLDEAQVLLEGQSTAPTDLDYILEGISRPYGDDFMKSGVVPYVTEHIVSGTSLRLNECTVALNHLLDKKIRRGRFEERGRTSKMEVGIETNLPLLLTDQAFECLLRSHIRRVVGRILYLRQLDREKVRRFGFAETLLPPLYQTSLDIFSKNVAVLDSLPEQTIDHTAKVIENYFMAKNRKRWVIIYSLPLRGRYRWSVLYIEHLLAHYLNRIDSPEPILTGQEEDYAKSLDFLESQTGEGEPAKNLSDGDEMMLDSDESIQERKESTEDPGIPSDLYWISEQSRNCQDVIKSALRKRLEDLGKGHKPEHIYILEDLYWTAIRADLMHKPCILQDTMSGQLITEGFAHMDSFHKTTDGSRAVVKQKLAEPLAVAAVIEHLRAQEGDRLKNMLKRLLFDNQDDASSFGKTAEFYLAWSFGGLLHSDPTTPHMAPQSREVFIDVLNNAKFVTGSRDPDQQLLNLIEYNLHIPAPNAPTNGELGSSLEFHQWLRCIRKRAFFPTFYFPSIFAGPDIVFTMKHSNPAVKTTIVCAIQLKTGESCQKKDAAKVLSTIDPNLWFSSKPGKGKKRALEDEINKWNGTLEPVTVLFTTSVSIQEFFAFKACSVLPPSGSTVGKRVLEEALQVIAEEGKTSLSEEDGKRIIGDAHQTVTDKPWGKLAKDSAGQLVGNGSPLNLSDLNLSGNSTQENVGGQQDAFPRRRFRFAVLERRHTSIFFGKSVDELIGLIKDLKRDLPEDEGEELNEEELVALMAEQLTIAALKYCLKEMGSTGYSRLPKKELTERVVQEARRRGFDDILSLIRDAARLKLTKRGATESLIARDTKKVRTK